MELGVIEIIGEYEIKSCFDGRICRRCGDNKTYIGKDGSPKWHKFKIGEKGNYDRDGYWDRKSYLCNNCYFHFINKNRGPSNFVQFIKESSKWRNEKLSRYSNIGEGSIGQWIIAKTLELEDLTIKNENFREPIDLSENTEVKTASLIYGEWHFVSEDKECDNVFLVCMDDNVPWKRVERICAIPWNEANKRKSIAIVKDPSRPVWYKDFMIDERPFNETYNSVEIPEFFSPFDLWKGKYDKNK